VRSDLVVYHVANVKLLADSCSIGQFRECSKHLGRNLVCIREKSISLGSLHAVNFIMSCRVMASLKEKFPAQTSKPLSMPRKRLQASLIRSHCASSSKAGCLVFKARLKVLLAFWQHFVLLLALQVGQLRNSLVDDLERGLDLFLGDDKRRCQTDDVLVGGLGL